MDQFDLVLFYQTAGEANSCGHVKSSGGHRWPLMVTQAMPLNIKLRQFFLERSTTLLAFRAVSLDAFITQQRKPHPQLAQFFQIGNDLALPERIEHAVVRDIKHAPICESHESQSLGQSRAAHT